MRARCAKCEEGLFKAMPGICPALRQEELGMDLAWLGLEAPAWLEHRPEEEETRMEGPRRVRDVGPRGAREI